MTQLTQTHTRSPNLTFAAVALAAAMLGGIIGSAVQILGHGSTGGTPGVASRDQIVVQAAREWEARYRQQYPNSL